MRRWLNGSIRSNYPLVLPFLISINFHFFCFVLSFHFSLFRYLTEFQSRFSAFYFYLQSRTHANASMKRVQHQKKQKEIVFQTRILMSFDWTIEFQSLYTSTSSYLVLVSSNWGKKKLVKDLINVTLIF